MVLGVFLLAVACVAPPAVAGAVYDLDAGRESLLGAASAGGGLLVIKWNSEMEPLSETELADLDIQTLPSLDRVAAHQWSPAAARASDVLVTGMMIAPLGLLADTGSDMSSGDFLAMYAETMLLERIVVGAIKAQVRRVRPLAYNPDPAIPNEVKLSRFARRSFPSGHTSSAFAGAMFASEVYARLHPHDDARHWVRAGSLGLAALTGYFRVRAGKHFPTDVLAGAAIGTLIGWAIPKLHEVDRDSDPGNPDPTDKAIPIGLMIPF
jgi:membrane-associated phospholipid phosphatase